MTRCPICKMEPDVENVCGIYIASCQCVEITGASDCQVEAAWEKRCDKLSGG